MLPRSIKVRIFGLPMLLAQRRKRMDTADMVALAFVVLGDFDPDVDMAEGTVADSSVLDRDTCDHCKNTGRQRRI